MTTASPRLRRRPEEAEREIIDAAESVLREGGIAALSPAAVMARTGLSRSSFYVYFRDVPALLGRLMERLEGEIFAVTQAWFAGDGDPEDDVRRSCEGVAAVYQRHGPVLRAISDAAASDSAVEHTYRFGVLDHFIAAVEERIDAEIARGRIRRPVPRSVARPLVLMTERYLTETLGHGHPGGRPAAGVCVSPVDLPVDVVVDTLTVIWVRTLYG